MSDFARKVIEVVGNLPDEGEPPEEFVHGAFGLLAAAISKLPAAERERELLTIEAGDLRRAVGMFPQQYGSIPRVSNGNGVGH